MKYYSEKELQNKIVRHVSENYPFCRGMFFEINNECVDTNRVALGHVNGVGDLMFINDIGEVFSIELKLEGSRHEVAHVKQQIEWGLKLMSFNGYYIMSSDYNYVITTIRSHNLTGIFRDQLILRAEKMLEYLNNLKTKTFTYNEENYI
jgi:hypothetical protein